MTSGTFPFPRRRCHARTAPGRALGSSRRSSLSEREENQRCPGTGSARCQARRWRRGAWPTSCVFRLAAASRGCRSWTCAPRSSGPGARGLPSARPGRTLSLDHGRTHWATPPCRSYSREHRPVVRDELEVRPRRDTVRGPRASSTPMKARPPVPKGTARGWTSFHRSEMGCMGSARGAVLDIQGVEERFGHDSGTDQGLGSVCF